MKGEMENCTVKGGGAEEENTPAGGIKGIWKVKIDKATSQKIFNEIETIVEAEINDFEAISQETEGNVYLKKYDTGEIYIDGVGYTIDYKSNFYGLRENIIKTIRDMIYNKAVTERKKKIAIGIREIIRDEYNKYMTIQKQKNTYVNSKCYDLYDKYLAKYYLNETEKEEHETLRDRIYDEAMTEEEFNKVMQRLNELYEIAIERKRKEEEERARKEAEEKAKEEAKRKALEQIEWVKELVNAMNIEQETQKERQRFLKKFQITEDFITDEYEISNKPYVRIQAEIDLSLLGIDRKLKIYNYIFEDSREDEDYQYYNFSDLSKAIAKKLAEIFNGEVIVRESDGTAYLNVETEHDTINIASIDVYDC